MLKCGNKVINLSTDQNAYTDIATLTQINMDYGCWNGCMIRWSADVLFVWTYTTTIVVYLPGFVQCMWGEWRRRIHRGTAQLWLGVATWPVAY